MRRALSRNAEPKSGSTNRLRSAKWAVAIAGSSIKVIAGERLSCEADVSVGSDSAAPGGRRRASLPPTPAATSRDRGFRDGPYPASRIAANCPCETTASLRPLQIQSIASSYTVSSDPPRELHSGVSVKPIRRWPCKASASMSPSLADFVAVQGYFSEVQEHVADSRPINRLSKI